MKGRKHERKPRDSWRNERRTDRCRPLAKLRGKNVAAILRRKQRIVFPRQRSQGQTNRQACAPAHPISENVELRAEGLRQGHRRIPGEGCQALGVHRRAEQLREQINPGTEYSIVGCNAARGLVADR